MSHLCSRLTIIYDELCFPGNDRTYVCWSVAANKFLTLLCLLTHFSLHLLILIYVFFIYKILIPIPLCGQWVISSVVLSWLPGLKQNSVNSFSVNPFTPLLTMPMLLRNLGSALCLTKCEQQCWFLSPEQSQCVLALLKIIWMHL